MADETQDLFEKLALKQLQKKQQPKAKQQAKSAIEIQTDSVEAVIPLQDIKDRLGGDTRSLNPDHVKALAESIGAVGLVQPLAVDSQGRLLAGGHRRGAIELLKGQNPEAYDQHFKGDRVPVRAFDFDSEKEPERALGIEVTENEQRRDYTAAEVKQLAERLRAAGYVDRRGRPKEGELRLKPALEVIIGKSARTVQRLLYEDDEAKQKIQPNGRIKRDALLTRAIASLKKWEAAEPVDEDEQKLLKQVQGMIKKLEQGLSETE